MSPDPQTHLLQAIRQGPAFLPDGLLEGARSAQYRALKAHANGIAHAHHVALEDTYPHTRDYLGAEAFHAAATRFLGDDAPARPLRRIGEGFAAMLDEPRARDRARVEWAWLEAHGAADAPALLLERLRGVTPERLIAAKVRAHPAARCVALEDSGSWPDIGGEGSHLLLTRPEAEVLLARVTRHEAALLSRARTPIPFGVLLSRHADAATTLVRVGALRPLLEIVP